MKIYVQWSQSHPQDYVAYDSSEWSNLPNKGEPLSDVRGGSDDDYGWINRLNVQGVSFPHDKLAVEEIEDGGIRVYAWEDDKEDYAPEDYCARVWTFLPLFRDPSVGGLWNTRQSRVIFAGSNLYDRWVGFGPVENTEILPWSDWTPPSLAITRFGIWLPYELYVAHVEAAPNKDFREWAGE